MIVDGTAVGSDGVFEDEDAVAGFILDALGDGGGAGREELHDGVTAGVAFGGEEGVDLGGGDGDGNGGFLGLGGIFIVEELAGIGNRFLGVRVVFLK